MMQKLLSSRITRIVVAILIWVIAVFLVFAVYFAAGIYLLRWQGPVIEKIEKIIPYPAAAVNFQPITFASFNTWFSSNKKYMSENLDFNYDDPANAGAVKKQKRDMLDRMIDLKLEKIFAAGKGIKISKAEIAEELKTLAGTGQADFEKKLKADYGWKLGDFTNQVVIPKIREEKIKKFLALDEQVNSDALRRAKEVKDKISKGGDFAALASQYSTDLSTKYLGGELGWVIKDNLSPDFREAVFKLEPNQTSDIIASPYGLHILQVMEKSQAEDGTVKAHLRQIMVTGFDFSRWLSELRKKAFIWSYNL